MRTRRLVPLTILALAGLTACEDASAPLAPDSTDPDPVVLPDAPRLSPLSNGIEGYPTVGELRTGYIVGRDGQPLEIIFEIHDGLAIWQGDMVLGEVHEIASTPAALAGSAQGPLRGVVIDADGGNNRWPNGVIPYTISASDPPTQSIVDDAIDWIEDQTPGVTLVPRGSQGDYVTFRDASGCSSEIGRVGGQQFINLKVDDGVTLCTVGNAAHEILHALGMFHEHTRCDRDDFVDIDFDEIETDREHNFYKAGSDSEGGACSGAFDIGAYDFGSIMHYAVDAFQIGSNPTIIPTATVPAGVTIGQRNGLSDIDAETIHALYGTNNASPVPSIVITGDLLEGSTLNFDASASTDPDDDDDILTFSWLFGDATCPGPAKCSDDTPDHAYVDNGNYGYSVTVSDGFDSGAMGASLDILNVAPDVSAGTDAEVESGQTYAFSGTFSDPGIIDNPWAWTIDWGDGTDVSGSTNDQSAAIEASLQVCMAGTYTVELSVTDKDGGLGSDDLELTVPYVVIEIDIMPGSDTNPINLKSGGNVPVAILGSADLDVADLDPSTLILGDEVGSDTAIGQKRNGAYEAYMEDVNGDGITDLVVMFPNRDLAMNDLSGTSTELVLRGFQTDACTHMRGVDVVSIPGT